MALFQYYVRLANLVAECRGPSYAVPALVIGGIQYLVQRISMIAPYRYDFHLYTGSVGINKDNRLRAGVYHAG